MFMFSRPKRRIYLDNAAATPLHSEVKKAMWPFIDQCYGNPSAIHAEGILARQAVEEARQKIATILGIRVNEIIFTASGTESNNLAILGLIKKLHREDGLPYTEMEIVTTRIEHPSIMSLLPVLQNTGVNIRFAEVDSEGKIIIPTLVAALSPKTVLVTFAYANSEVGVIQDVHRLVREIRRYQKEHGRKIFVHVDAAQAPLWLPCGLERLGVDLMSLDVGKCNGPKGIGVLAKRGEISLLPILYGGGQEQGLRPGTENVAGIVGAAKALELAQGQYEKRSKKVSVLRDYFINKLRVALPNVSINGPEGNNRLANNINISLISLDTEYAVVYLDANQIAASTKSACAGAGSGESQVVLVLSGDSIRARSTLRFSLGEETTAADLDQTLNVLCQYQKKMQELTN
jgi:cysteine desulfurase